MTEIFQYVNGNSWIYRLNPLTKIAFCFFIILVGILINDIPLMLVLLALPVIGLALSGLAREIVAQLKMLIVIIVFFIVVTAVSVRSGTDYVVAGIPLATSGGLMFGIVISLRLAAMFYAFTLLSNTTKPSDLVNTLVSRLHFPMDYALMLMITLRFIPTLQIEARRIREAQAVRGFNAKGLKNLKKSIGPTITPLLSNSIGRAGSLGHIIELRGYHSGNKIRFTSIPLRAMDFVFILLMAATFIAYILYLRNII